MVERKFSEPTDEIVQLEPVEVTDWEVTEQLLHRGLVFGDPQEADHPRTVQIVTGVMGALPPGWTLLHQLDVSQDSIDALPADEHRVLDLVMEGTVSPTGPAQVARPHEGDVA